MSLWKAIEHNKEHRDIRHYHDCRCERCCMNRLYSAMHRASVDDNGDIIGNRRVIRGVKALKNGVTNKYKG